jgi:hypothetical protein
MDSFMYSIRQYSSFGLSCTPSYSIVVAWCPQWKPWSCKKKPQISGFMYCTITTKWSVTRHSRKKSPHLKFTINRKRSFETDAEISKIRERLVVIVQYVQLRVFRMDSNLTCYGVIPLHNDAISDVNTEISTGGSKVGFID